MSFICTNGYEYVAAQWAIWRAGGIAVPLCNTHPLPELEYIIQDSQSDVLLVHRRFEKFMKPLCDQMLLSAPKKKRILMLDDIMPRAEPSQKHFEIIPADESQRAMLIYTSGTTGKPKGVVFTHAMIKAQVTGLLKAWEWSSSDRILHVLPLHHVHGIINVLTCALWKGATCEFMHFDAKNVWERFVEKKHAVSLFMAVPTIYGFSTFLRF